VTLRLTILGCGSSPGVPKPGPIAGGDWGVCDPNEPKNRRRRCSLLIERIGEYGETTVIVDTSPDFRAQVLAANVTRIDGVVFTHSHADHVHGFDDIRPYYQAQGTPIPVYADEPTRQRIMDAFRYCFESPPGDRLYPPIAAMNDIRPGEILSVDGPGGPVELLPVLQLHGPIPSLGFRIGGDLAQLKGGVCYSPDISGLPAQSLELLADLDCWIVDALKPERHLSHFSLEEALEWIARIKPRRAILTHLHITLDYATLRRDLPGHIVPAHDGMVVEMPD